MTPELYLKSMTRYIKMDERALFSAYVDQVGRKAALPPTVEGDIPGLKARAIDGEMQLIANVMGSKFSINIHAYGS